MAKWIQRVPRWAAAAMVGVFASTILLALFAYGFGLDLQLSAWIAGTLGISVVFAMMRWPAAATVVLGILDAALSALLIVLAAIAAIFGAFS